MYLYSELQMHYSYITESLLKKKGIKVNLSICGRLNLVDYCHEVTKKLRYIK